MAKVRRRLVAIFSADVVGYSRLMGDDERATMVTLQTYRSVFHRHISDYGGRVVDMAGDSVLALFASVVEAVKCAMGVQDELERHNAELPDRRKMFFRVGINLGDIFEEADGTVYGNGVNVAARLEGLAEPGGLCLSGTAYEQIEGKIDGVFEDIGEHPVKNIAKPVRVFRLAYHDTIPIKAITGDESKLASAGRPSIAVLPFDNLSGDSEQEYLADGMAEDLITALSHIRWLSVIARNSTFTYKGQAVDVKRVGREMGVRYVLEGSVRKGRDRVRITAQLIDAVSGNHIWAKRYDRDLADLFEVQDELTEAIAGEIEPELAHVERERAHRRPPENLDAWECYQRGLWHMWQLNREDNGEAQRLFLRAATLDPGASSAFAGLAHSRFLGVALGFSDAAAEDLQKAQEAALTAVAIDMKDAIAHCVLGRICTALGDHRAALIELDKAIELNPSFALAHHGRGLCLLLTGRWDEAVPELEQAVRLSPHDPYAHVFLAVQAAAHNALGQFRLGEAAALRAARHPRATFWAYAHLAQSLAGQERFEQAREALNTLLELRPDFSREFFDRVWPNADLTLVTAYFGLLRDAGMNVPQDAEG